MTSPVLSAVILAAGSGSRLRGIVADRPKGLLPFGGTTPAERSVSLLRGAGVRDIVLVAGYRAEWYHRLAEKTPGLTVVENADFAATGSMASLHCALPRVRGEFLLLESDLVYESRALGLLLDRGPGSALLVSGPTGAGDEVWVEASGSRLRAMDKDRSRLRDVAGEFVGLCRVTAELAAAMDDALARFVRRTGHGRMDYETGAMVEAAAVCPVDVVLAPHLIWGEIDDARHYERLIQRVWPGILAAEAGKGNA